MFLKSSVFYICLLFAINFGYSQGRFNIVGKENVSESIPFKLVNNMIVIKGKINGKELAFILDTGIKRTMLFNLQVTDTIPFRNVKQLQIRGLGEGQPIQAHRSMGNLFQMGGIVNPSMSVFIITDDLFDLSAKMGMDVHGIIGGDLFRDFVVKINYVSERIQFYEPEAYEEKKCRGCETFPLDFYNEKPFIDVYVENHLGKEIKVKLLIDSGGGDSLWLFTHSNPDILVPEKYFDDFLGRGLSGNIYGKRSKINKLRIGSFVIENAAVSFPDSTSMVSVHANRDRNGTLGAGILKRFNVVMDYPNRRITLKKNSKFKSPFLYNKSGMELMFGGEMLVKVKRATLYQTGSQSTRSATEIVFNYGLTYKPSFQISQIRRGSPAHLAGLIEGDILLEINGIAAYSLKMEEVIHMLSQKSNKKIKVLVDRNGQHLSYQFTLKDLL